jgi:hypothetical protein
MQFHVTHSVVKACAEPMNRPAARIVERIVILVVSSGLGDCEERETKLKNLYGYDELFEFPQSSRILQHHRQRKS